MSSVSAWAGFLIYTLNDINSNMPSQVTWLLMWCWLTTLFFRDNCSDYDSIMKRAAGCCRVMRGMSY